MQYSSFFNHSSIFKLYYCIKSLVLSNSFYIISKGNFMTPKVKLFEKKCVTAELRYVEVVGTQKNT